MRFSDIDKESISAKSRLTETDFEVLIDSSKSEFNGEKNRFDIKIKNPENGQLSSHCHHFASSERALKGFALMKTLSNLLSESFDSKKNSDIRKKALVEYIPIPLVNSNEPKYTSYGDRLRRTPKENVRWSGKRGESLCYPSSDEAKKILEASGLKGVEYRNGVPDFSPFSEITVQLGNMTSKRFSHGIDGKDSKDTIYVHYDQNGVIESRIHRVNRNSLSDLNLKYNSPGNFDQADAVVAKLWTDTNRDDREWSAKDISEYRKQNGLTWHECNDGFTMMMIPKAINTDFRHLGGVGEVNEKERLLSKTLGGESEGWLESGDIEHMTDPEFATFERHALRKKQEDRE